MGSGVGASDLAEYFAKSKSFDEDRAAAAVRSRQTAWWLATAFGVMALASMSAVIGMLPLRTVEVHVFRVDNATGVVELVSPPIGTQTYNDAVGKYWAATYVRAREGYLPDQAPVQFKTVALMSDEREQRRFAEWWSPQNPLSPQMVVGREGAARIDVKSISFLSPKVALVRFSRTVERGNERKSTMWVSTLTFAYVQAPGTESERLINPLGYQVYEYQIVPEAL
jgi:type IV secretion system protein VirB8